MKKSTFYWSMMRYSILHPIEAIEILKISRDVKNDKKSKLDYNLSSNIPDTLSKIFEKYENSNYENELVCLKEHLRKKIEELEKEQFPSKKKPYPTDYLLNMKEGSILYQICKNFQPEIIVETGVAYGSSSSHILLALKNNQKGKLYSIDSTFRPWETKKMIGSIVPDHLKEKWNLIFGKSSKELKKILFDLKEIDIFFHDSLHTYKNMMFEFETVWPFLKNGGIIISDDITSNNAFRDFCKTKKDISVVVGDSTWSLGIIKKME